MGYYDGNTVTALWNYAQSFAMNDNSYTTQYGPSTPGAINLISGQTNGIAASEQGRWHNSRPRNAADGHGGYTMIGDADPLGDVCSTAPDQVTMAGKNVGDLLNAQTSPGAAFMGGFDLTVTNPNGTTGCNRRPNPTVPDVRETRPTTSRTTPVPVLRLDREPDARAAELVASHRPQQRDRRHHAGTGEPPVRHHDFFDALAAGNLPAVSYLKAPAFQDGHAGYSDPVDEQASWPGDQRGAESPSGARPR